MEDVAFVDEFWSYINREENARTYWGRRDEEPLVRIHKRCQVWEKKMFFIAFGYGWRKIVATKQWNQESYLAFLKSVTKQLAGKTLIQDGASSHCGKKVKEWFEENHVRTWFRKSGKNDQQLRYPCGSPTLNRAELAIAMTKQHFKENPTAETLERITIEAFNSLKLDTLQKLFNGYKAVLKKVINRRGVE